MEIMNDLGRHFAYKNFSTGSLLILSPPFQFVYATVPVIFLKALPSSVLLVFLFYTSLLLQNFQRI